MRRAILIVAVLACLVSGMAVGLFAGGAGAQNPYYNNTTVDNDTANVSVWLEGREEATLDNVTHVLTWVSTFVIGERPEGGVRALLTAILLLGVFLGFIAGGRIGTVGGASIGLGALGGLALAGVVPFWLYAMSLFALGVVLAAVTIRALR